MSAPEPVPHLVSVSSVPGSAEIQNDELPEITPPYTRALIAAIFFFLPIGLLALFFSWRCERAKASNEVNNARRSETIAKRFALLSFLVGGAIYGFLVTAFLMLGAFAS